METSEHTVSAPWEGVLVKPVGGSAVGVLVLAGSSGRVETQRCRLLAGTGVTALSIRWFGGQGQPAGINEIALETSDRFRHRGTAQADAALGAKAWPDIVSALGGRVASVD